MEQQIRKANEMTSSLVQFKGLLSQDDIKKKFNEALGKKAPVFMSNLVTIMSSNAELQKCEHMSIVSSALMAASMDLPLTQGLGFAGIVPYWDSASGMMKAQFQVMKKGYIQLAQRTGLLKTINVCEVYEGEIIKHNRFTGEYEFDETKKLSEKVIGYVSYFKLVNGFEKYYYMPIEKLDKHARQFSKSFQRGKGKWADKEQGGYEQMCEKTVLKLNLSTYAPMSNDINMMNAIIYDQAEIRDLEANDYDYMDNDNSEQPSKKEVLTTGDGKSIVIDDKTQKRSQNLTSKAANKIDKINPDTNKSSSSSEPIQGFNTEELDKRIESIQENNKKEEEQKENALAGKVYTKEELKSLGLKKVKEIIENNSEMKEASEIIPGDNTMKKLAAILLAYQEGRLAPIVDEYKKSKPEEIPENTSDDTSNEEIQHNNDFDNEKENNSEVNHSDYPLTNKFNIDVTEIIQGETNRRFNELKQLYDDLKNIAGIDNKVYEVLVGKFPEFQQYRSREDFCMRASVGEINYLLNAAD